MKPYHVPYKKSCLAQWCVRCFTACMCSWTLVRSMCSCMLLRPSGSRECAPIAIALLKYYCSTISGVCKTKCKISGSGGLHFFSIRALKTFADAHICRTVAAAAFSWASSSTPSPRCSFFILLTTSVGFGGGGGVIIWMNGWRM